jgi:hypothetical protein
VKLVKSGPLKIGYQWFEIFLQFQNEDRNKLDIFSDKIIWGMEVIKIQQIVLFLHHDDCFFFH